VAKASRQRGSWPFIGGETFSSANLLGVPAEAPSATAADSTHNVAAKSHAVSVFCFCSPVLTARL
jgi:hypothetical protein